MHISEITSHQYDGTMFPYGYDLITDDIDYKEMGSLLTEATTPRLTQMGNGLWTWQMPGGQQMHQGAGFANQQAAIKWGQANPSLFTKATPSASLGSKVANMFKGSGSTATTAATATTKTPSVVGKFTKDTILPGLKDWATRKDLADIGANKTARALGGYLRIVKWLGFAPLAYQHYTNMAAIEDMVKTGALSKNDGAVAKRMEAERMIVEIMATQAFPNLIKWVLRIRYLKLIPQAFGAVATILTGGVFGGVEIATILLTEAVALWIQKWLATEEGQQAMAACVMYFIDPALNFLWDMGPGMVVGHLKQLSPEGAAKLDANKKVVGGSGTVDAFSSSGSGSGNMPNVNTLINQVGITGSDVGNVAGGSGNNGQQTGKDPKTGDYFADLSNMSQDDIIALAKQQGNVKDVSKRK